MNEQALQATIRNRRTRTMLQDIDGNALLLVTKDAWDKLNARVGQLQRWNDALRGDRSILLEENDLLEDQAKQDASRINDLKYLLGRIHALSSGQ